MLATIQKWGNSNGIRIPKIILDELNLNENDKVEITMDNSCIVISKPKRKYTSLTELFADYDGNYKGEEYDWGKPVGNEVW